MDKLKRFSRSLLLFVSVFIVAQLILVNCFGLGAAPQQVDGNINVEVLKSSYPVGKLVTVKVTNSTTETLTIPHECPNPPLQVHKIQQNQAVLQIPEFADEIDCSNATDIIIPSGTSTQVTFKNWNNQLFGETGTYSVTLETEIDGTPTIVTSNNFQIKEPGIFRQLWNGIIYRPIYNALILAASYSPGYNLGIAIILLTLLIRTILLVPAGKAMKSQRKMSEIQPRIQEVKEKYKGDQQRIAMETMALWKEANVSPVGSCLPILLQFPFLIAIFYAVQNGINPDNHFLLYTTYNNVSLADINTNFLGLNLLTPNIYILPLIVGSLQFVQLKLATFKTAKQNKKSSAPGSKEMQTAQKTMVFIMPALIAVFTASLPAGVGIYWGTSTLYGIIQQIFINKSSTSGSNSNEVKVKVIKS
ncbi:hypothetical protein CVV38_04410 [Candidatus Peregrinibacteria bacterium HGW-Peregrinibacteria-1]|jgi:YidC/Oxa1 family membrane protein insertase|nr:MAG: hypothetical protein CVV38_04410 [Candidatus Peregrinibacteria bacterium HGW-Peregrinibacteria-1]